MSLISKMGMRGFSSWSWEHCHGTPSLPVGVEILGSGRSERESDFSLYSCSGVPAPSLRLTPTPRTVSRSFDLQQVLTWDYVGRHWASGVTGEGTGWRVVVDMV